jgi:comEA protein
MPTSVSSIPAFAIFWVLFFRFQHLFLAQKCFAPLVIRKEEDFLSLKKLFQEDLKMVAKKIKVACVLALCLGMAISSVSVLAQKSNPAPAAEKVNLNSATVEQLQAIPGIGPVIAKSIVEHRTKVGRFSRIEEIINVKGIGEKKFQKIKDRLVV